MKYVKSHDIYFIRHGQTDWNVIKRKQGQTNVPLNNFGREQAKRNGQELKSILTKNPEKYDFVSSPLCRCKETIEIIRYQLGLRSRGYRTDERLMEINYGEWQGNTWDELRETKPEQVNARFTDPWNTTAPEGENYAQLSSRALDWLSEIQQDTIVVGHGGINRCLRGFLEGVESHEIPSIDVPQDRIMKIAGNTIKWH